MAPAAAPFHFPGGRISCLLLHGFTATPEEMRFLGERLAALGHTVRGTRLAGHGTHEEDLRGSRWQDWCASARADLEELREESDQVFVIGQSMGALIALHLAAEHPRDIAGLALLAPAIRLRQRWLPWIRPLLPLLALAQPYQGKDSAGDVADPESLTRRLTYRRIPLRSVHQMLELRRRVLRRLPSITPPALVMHSRQDHTCDATSLEVLARRLGGSVDTVLLEDSFHCLSVDVDRETVADRIGSFVQRVAAVG